MRIAFAAAAVLFASVACAKSPARPLTARAIEISVNQRLDRQLHSTLKRLLDAQAYRTASLEARGGQSSLLTQR